jgi:membrane associated rhomboid family serine protease
MILAVPLYDDNPTARAPVITYYLIGMCAGAFLWELGHNGRAVLYGYGMIPAELFGLWHPPRAFRVVPPWATVLTSMFLHGGWFHLIGNMLFLWIFGNNIEDVLGRARYLCFYLCCGVVAALTQAFSIPTSHVPMVGASGAIAGVLGAYLLLYPNANVHCFVWIVIFFRIVNVPAWILLGLWFMIQLVNGLAKSPGTPGVAFWAHVGGFVSGVVLITLWRPSGVRLLQPRRTRVFAIARPSVLAGRQTLGRGSVPSAGRPGRRPRGPWDC